MISATEHARRRKPKRKTTGRVHESKDTLVRTDLREKRWILAASTRWQYAGRLKPRSVPVEEQLLSLTRTAYHWSMRGVLSRANPDSAAR